MLHAHAEDVNVNRARDIRLAVEFDESREKSLVNSKKLINLRGLLGRWVS